MAPLSQEANGNNLSTSGNGYAFSLKLTGVDEDDLKEVLRLYLLRRIAEVTGEPKGQGYRKFQKRTGVPYSQVSKIIGRKDGQGVSYGVLCRIASTVGPDLQTMFAQIAKAIGDARVDAETAGRSFVELSTGKARAALVPEMAKAVSESKKTGRPRKRREPEQREQLSAEAPRRPSPRNR